MSPAYSDLEDVVRPLEPLLLQDGHAYVEDRYAARGPPLEAPVVRVPMYRQDRAPIVQGPREVARPEKGVYLRRFSLHRGTDRRVVEDGDAPLGLQPPELVLEGLRLHE